MNSNDGVNVEVTLTNTTASSSFGTPYSTKSAPVGCTIPVDANMSYGGGGSGGFFDGVFGCLRPVLTFIGKATVAELKQQGFLSLFIC